MKYLQPAKKLQNYGLGVSPEHKTICPICRKNNASIFFNSEPTIRTNQVFPCDKCRLKTEKKNIQERRWYEKNARGVFQHRGTGEEVVLDQRGKIMENPYKNREFDQHGWMQTQKKQFKRHLESEGKI